MRIFRLGRFAKYFRRGSAVPVSEADAPVRLIIPGAEPGGIGTKAGPRVASASSAGGAAQRGAVQVREPSAAVSAGLHELTRVTDQWFANELSVLERHAADQAAAWAAAGLPRLDVADEALSVEVALEKRCTELFRRWVERVRHTVEDMVHDALREAGSALLRFRVHLAELRRSLGAVAEAERRLERIRWERAEGAVTFGFPRLLPRSWFWTLIVLLMIVDLVANIPIFHELVPHDTGEDLLWQDLAARSERYGLGAGLYRVAARLLFAPDITLLALGVIAFLVFSAHVFGEALRQRVGLREEDVPAARIGIRSHRRQWILPAFGSALATLLVIFFLFVSRIIVEDTARTRFMEAATQVTELETALTRARAVSDLDAIGEIESQLPTARAVLADRERKLQYATGIAAMNRPILLLNLVLALAAAIASYLAKEERITDGRSVDPRLLAAEERVAMLRKRIHDEREALRSNGERAAMALARAQRLLEARPLRGWEAKAERLQGVIALFRAENARLRGIDPANIVSFRRNLTLELPVIDPEAPFPTPDDLARHQAEFGRLQAELDVLDEPPPEPAPVEAV